MQNEPTAELVEIVRQALQDAMNKHGPFSTSPVATAVLAAVTPLIEARVVGEIVALLRFGLDDWPDYVAPPDIADTIERGDYKETQP